MEFELKSDKIKDIDFLLNKLTEREEELNTSKNCFFLGAGCSISSGIPSGSGIIEICRKLAYIANRSHGFKHEKHENEHFDSVLIDISKFVDNNLEKYSKYLEDREVFFQKQLGQNDVIKLLPENIIVDYAKTSKLEGDELKQLLFREFKSRILSDMSYSNWFEEYSQDPRTRQRLIEKIITDRKASGEYILFANLVQQGYINNIFTTNFDDLINEALISFVGIKAKVYSHNETAAYISIGSRKPNIIKLHGDYLYENIKNLNEETKDLENNMKVKLKEALKILDIIVVGYQGADHSIISLFEEIKKERPFGLIWCGSNAKNLHWRVINLINNSKNSFFVQIDDFETIIIKIWNNLGQSIKDVEEIAEKKNTELRNSLMSLKLSVEKKLNITSYEKSNVTNYIKAHELFNAAFKEKDNTKAIEIYTSVLQILPEDPNIYNNRGVLYARLGEYDKALSDYNKSIDLNPEQDSPYINRSDIYAHSNLLHNAIEDLNFLLSKNSQNVMALSKKGILLQKLGDNKTALELLNRAIMIDLTNPDSYIARGLLLGESGQFDAAISDYEEALKLGAREKAIVFNDIAIIFRRKKEFEKALKYLEDAQNIDDQLNVIYGTKALTYADMGDEENFYINLKIALDKGCPVWYYLDDTSFDKYRGEKLTKLVEEYRLKNSVKL